MDDLFNNHHVSGVSIRNYLIANGWVLKLKSNNDGPAQVFCHPDYQGEIGLIMPYEKDFCKSCNRSARLCFREIASLPVFGDHGVDLRDLLQQDDQRD